MKIKNMKGRNCSVNCKYFHGHCESDSNGGLKFVEFCDIHNDKFLEFYEKYGNKNSAWVDENVIMSCFEPTENTEALDKFDESITQLLNEYDSGLESWSTTPT